MTVAVPSPPSRRPLARRFALAVAAAAVVAAPAAAAAPAGAANGLFWQVRWSAPVTAVGPNPFAGPPELRGTAAPPLAGNPAKVSYSVALPAGYPSDCAVPAGTATLKGQAFTATPAFACNGTYVVSVVAYQPASILKPNSDPLKAPVALADPGPAPTNVDRGVYQRRVTTSWANDHGPDVVGYRILRNGAFLQDVRQGTGAYLDIVPGPGDYTYAVQTLRWGAGGPDSAPIASPATAARPATVKDVDPPSEPGGGNPGGGNPGSGGPGSGGPGSGGGGGSGGTGNGGGSGTGPGSIPAAGASNPKVPGNGRSSGASGSRTTYRSGGTISSRSGGSSGTTATTEPDTFEEKLPYQPKDTGRTVELASPGTTRTVSKTIRTPHTSKPGLLVPMAVVLVLVAASIQIRSFLRRTAPAGLELELQGWDD